MLPCLSPFPFHPVPSNDLEPPKGRGFRFVFSRRAFGYVNTNPIPCSFICGPFTRRLTSERFVRTPVPRCYGGTPRRIGKRKQEQRREKRILCGKSKKKKKERNKRLPSFACLCASIRKKEGNTKHVPLCVFGSSSTFLSPYYSFSPLSHAVSFLSSPILPPYYSRFSQRVFLHTPEKATFGFFLDI